MDNRRNSGLWAAQASADDPNGMPAGPSKSSYRRSADGPEAGYTGRGGPPPASYSSNRSSGQNGVTRTSSHRRRDSMPKEPPTMPAAPEVPRAPPVSYRGPYGGATMIPNRTRGNPKQYPALDTRGGPPPSRSSAYNAPVSPISPVEPLDREPSRRGSTRESRRGSATEKSPLQKLEMNRDQKRAKLQEAESRLQELAPTDEGSRRLSRSGTGSQQRHVSDPHRPVSGAAPSSAEKRHVSGPIESQEWWSNTRNSIEARSSRPPTNSYPPANEPSSGAPARRRSAYRRERERERDVPPTYPEPERTSGPPARSASQYDRDRYYGARRPSADAGPGPGAESSRQAPPSGGVGRSGSVGRSPSRKLQKEPKWEYAKKPADKDKKLPDVPKEAPKSPYMNQPEPASKPEPSSSPVYTFTRRGSFAAPAKSYRMPPALADYSKAPAHDPPRTSRDERRQSVRETRMEQPAPEPTREPSRRITREVEKTPPAPVSVSPPEQRSEGHQHHHLPHLFHRHHENERRYAPPVELDEWKNAGTASLMGEDLFLEGPSRAKATAPAPAPAPAPPPPAGADKSTPWWEQSPSQRRRSSSYTQPTPKAAPVEPRSQPKTESIPDQAAYDSTGQTTFSPRLFLKCGPLLRYTGMRKEKTSSNREREIWRGSVMIVTEDSYSSYETPPTLSLFSQPMDLLPPPPAQLDAASGNLAPEYVDPLRGQPHLSRTGRTLYVRPIENVEVEADLSRLEDDNGLFEEIRTEPTTPVTARASKIPKRDGERLGKVRNVKGVRLHAERGVTFWRFNLEVELGSEQARIAYRINRGPATGFWVPAKGETMNIMFHSCNGFSLSVDSRQFCGPDPMWRDVLNNHQTRPFHVMLGGGDQIYNDAAMRETKLFGEWSMDRNPQRKSHAEFTLDMQDELERFYLDRYSMWFSQGLFGMANSQIPMVNIWDDHDIIDGYGSYPDHFMKTPVFTGIGAIAFKYYMLFQHQSVPAETTKEEPSWLLGYAKGPYIKELSRSIFVSLGKKVAFLGLDCRTERMRDEILTQETYDNIFDRLNDEIVKGQTKHLIVLLGVVSLNPFRKTSSC
jgi:hypothetical protein